jgi:hypothetical protein
MASRIAIIVVARQKAALTIFFSTIAHRSEKKPANTATVVFA